MEINQSVTKLLILWTLNNKADTNLKNKYDFACA